MGGNVSRKEKFQGKDDLTNILCARKLLDGHIELLIYQGDILKEETDVIVLPADPHLPLKQEHIRRAFKIQIDHLEAELENLSREDKSVIKYENLKIPSAHACYFCKVPSWTGKYEERDAYTGIIGDLFELLIKDKVAKITIYPLNKSIGGFPYALLSRILLFNINVWIDEYLEHPDFCLSSINIVCDCHPMARAMCLEMQQMDLEYEIGGFNLRGNRRLSEEMIIGDSSQRNNEEDEESIKKQIQDNLNRNPL